MITTVILLILSATINAFLGWYIVQLLKKLSYVSDNIESLFQNLSEYSKHLKKVYSQETYYGDATLGQLLDHSEAMAGEIETYAEIIDMFKEVIEEPTDEQEEIQ